MITYLSTRGESAPLDFAQATLAGLAEDGGLFVPENLPQMPPHTWLALANRPYADVAEAVLSPFIGDAIPAATLRSMIRDAYATFRHPAVAPLVQIGPGEYVLELFHGPTLAFKDIALQLLGRILDHLLKGQGRKVTVLGATSGDTGSAAIAGLRGRGQMDVFILHPKGRVSEVQRRQMTTVLDDNIHNIAIEGTFDDCQALVKQLFSDPTFRGERQLTAVNSINWARIMAQIVYYVTAALALGAPARRVSFAVPTGNFGDVYAGYLAARMGLPIHRLIVATNQNDILARFLATGEYKAAEVIPSLAPSMDIQVASNFERLLFDVLDRQGAEVKKLMDNFAKEKTFKVSPEVLKRVRAYFDGAQVQESDIRATLASVYKESGYVLDPHTACGVFAGRSLHDFEEGPLVHLATAHPAKFPEPVKEMTGVVPALPPHFSDLMQRQERLEVLPNDPARLKQFIEERS